MTEESGENIVYLPYGNLKTDYGAEPLKWLYFNLKGKFQFADSSMYPRHTLIQFDSKEDMELFILMWGEYLWKKPS